MVERYRGINVNWEIRDGKWICNVETIRKPFYKDGSYYFSLNDKIIEMAISRNAIISGKVGEKEYEIRPSKKTLKLKKKEGLIEEVATKFDGSPSWYRVLYKI